MVKHYVVGCLALLGTLVSCAHQPRVNIVDKFSAKCEREGYIMYTAPHGRCLQALLDGYEEWRDRVVTPLPEPQQIIIQEQRPPRIMWCDRWNKTFTVCSQ